MNNRGALFRELYHPIIRWVDIAHSLVIASKELAMSSPRGSNRSRGNCDKTCLLEQTLVESTNIDFTTKMSTLQLKVTI